MRRKIVALALGAASLMVAACQPPQGQQAQNGPFQPSSPWSSGPPQQPGMPQQPQPGMPQQPGWMQPQPMPVQGVPQGMRPVNSQAGYVFASDMNGTRSAQRLAQAVMSSVSDGFFDAQPQVMGTNGDPNDTFAQITFQATLRGAPVTGMISTVADGRGAGKGYLLFDSPQSIAQTGPMMMAAVQQDMRMGPSQGPVQGPGPQQW